MSSKFPFDLVVDIFPCLPVESLLRFRCLSKPCCYLIDSPYFIKLHLDHSLETNTNHSLIIEDHKPNGPLHGLDMDAPDKGFKEISRPFIDSFNSDFNISVDDDSPYLGGGDVFGCCNGLVALYKPNETMALWNPSTKKRHTVPKFWALYGGYAYLDGFGYDPTSDDYKLVRMILYGQRQQQHFEGFVYSVKTGSTRRVEDLPYHVASGFTAEHKVAGVLVGSYLHWMVRAGIDPVHEGLISAFDLGEEKFHLVPKPDLQGQFFFSLGVLRGCLAMNCMNRNDKYVEIWMMKEYGVKESWTRVCSFSKEENEKVHLCRLYMTPLCYSKTSNVILFLQDNRTLFWYDLETRERENVWTSSGPHRKIGAYICIRSLATFNTPPGSWRRRTAAGIINRRKSAIVERGWVVGRHFKFWSKRNA